MFGCDHVHNLSHSDREELITNIKNISKETNKMFNIVTTLRRPAARIISSFCQQKCVGEARIKQIKYKETSLMPSTFDLLSKQLISYTDKKHYPKESINEILEMLNITINDLNFHKESYATYQNQHIKLYVLSFDKISTSYRLDYLEKIFNRKFIDSQKNISKDKIYYEIQKKLTNKLQTHIANITNNHDHFYILSQCMNNFK